MQVIAVSLLAGAFPFALLQGDSGGAGGAGRGARGAGGGVVYRVVPGKAWNNVMDLGHAVFKSDGREEAELPGQIHLASPDAGKLADLVAPGLRVEIKEASS